ncbi:MAG: glutathione S-transferase [Nevskia sp.]|nr:glutathione S-transferase [Nevskia sp.]
MSELRIFSYLPNPRLWKATIAARLCGVALEVRGAAPDALRDWLWDFDARPLPAGEQAAQSAALRLGRVGFRGGRLYKTDAFLAAQPFGTVPAAFSPDGGTGIFESNSIMRAVARLDRSGSALYGRDAYEASRIDSFLDVSLVFARDAQHYLLALREAAVTRDLHARAAEAFATYLGGIEQALRPHREFLVGAALSLADICFFAEYSLFSNERLQRAALAAIGLQPISRPEQTQEFPLAMNHYSKLSRHPAFAADAAAYLDKLVAGDRA